MKREEIKVNQGGLMRCCLASAGAWARDDPDAEVAEGERIPCIYEDRETMIVRDGMIRWDSQS